jgi:hypothetical protein
LKPFSKAYITKTYALWLTITHKDNISKSIILTDLRKFTRQLETGRIQNVPKRWLGLVILHNVNSFLSVLLAQIVQGPNIIKHLLLDEIIKYALLKRGYF